MTVPTMKHIESLESLVKDIYKTLSDKVEDLEGEIKKELDGLKKRIEELEKKACQPEH